MRISVFKLENIVYYIWEKAYIFKIIEANREEKNSQEIICIDNIR